jgi:hypothetical protein
MESLFQKNLQHNAQIFALVRRAARTIGRAPGMNGAGRPGAVSAARVVRAMIDVLSVSLLLRQEELL